MKCAKSTLAPLVHTLYVCHKRTNTLFLSSLHSISLSVSLTYTHTYIHTHSYTFTHIVSIRYWYVQLLATKPFSIWVCNGARSDRILSHISVQFLDWSLTLWESDVTAHFAAILWRWLFRRRVSLRTMSSRVVQRRGWAHLVHPMCSYVLFRRLRLVYLQSLSLAFWWLYRG